MIDLLSWLPPETGREIGWTLIHFLWQGLLLAALLHAVLPFCRSAIARHNCALGILILMAWTPVATFLVLHDFGTSPFSGTIAAGPALPAPWMNGLVLLWLAGIAALSLRALGGWQLVRALERRDTLTAPADLLRRCHLLQRRLGVAGPVRFLLSRRIEVPVVLGWMRPMILIPLSALANLSPQQLDALILHELAHIRRLDTVTNVLLISVETILFYHPAVWWVSRQVRLEREHCCDDCAVQACGDALTYVEALTSLESWKAARPFALAANGGGLKTRVARLLDGPIESPRFSLSAMIGLALFALLAACVAAQTQTPAGAAKGTGAYLSNDSNPVKIRPIMETHQLPPYPRESVKLKEEGRVLVGVTIAPDGTVSQAVVVGPSGHERLDAAAANFVKGYWRWQPAMRMGKPVAAATRVSVLFKLKPPAKPPA